MINGRIKKYIKSTFRIFGYQVLRIPGAVVRREQVFWDSQNEFNILYAQVREHTLVSKNRCFMIYQLLRHAANMDGDIAEVGVYRGGTAKLIAKTAADKNVYLFDTFSGMPAITSKIDKHKAGEFRGCSLPLVKSFLKDCPNAIFYQGIFPDTADSIRDRKFSFVYLDVDLYNSVKDCLEFFYARIVTGGVIIIDDYGAWGCPGVKKAVCEFLADKKEYPIITTEIQCAIIKL